MKQEDITRSTRAVVNLSAVGRNIAAAREKIGKNRKLMAVVKADGYGHGALEISTKALRSGADCLGVALPEEAEPLRKAGIAAPILVLGLIQPDEAHKVVKLGLEQTVCSLEPAQALNSAAANASVKIDVHIKVDTGMGRIGVLPHDLIEYSRKIKQLKHLNLKGIFSHFACADESDVDFTNRQIRIFDQAVREVEASGIRIPQKHLANSAGVLAHPASYYDLVRPGIMIYGLYPSPETTRSIPLIPAMTLKSRVTQVKRVSRETPISYGRTFYTSKPAIVATLPVGYADGYNRRLSNRGFATIRGERAPLIGRVCMDMCMLDVTAIKDVRPGDEAILFGESPTVDDMAEQLNTINYEVVCAVGKRVPRIYE